MEKDKDHFNKIFWYVVGLTVFGMGFTIFLLIYFEKKVAERFADQAMMFWLTGGVAGGIGYLIGNSVKTNSKPPTVPGAANATISATIETNPGSNPDTTISSQ